MGYVGAPATFAAFAADRQHRLLTAKVKIAAKALGLTDDVYRGTMLRITSHASSKDCSNAELVRVVEHFKRSGWTDRPTSPAGKASKRRPADSPMARKARAMWISLHQLGAIDNPAEPALEAFARRQMKCEAMQWANQGQCYKLIEALKAIAARNGWDLTGIEKLPVADRPHVLKLRLVEAILAKLKAAGIVPEAWNRFTAAWRLCGIGNSEMPSIWSTSDLELIAKGLGDKLRAAKGAGGVA